MMEDNFLGLPLYLLGSSLKVGIRYSTKRRNNQATTIREVANNTTSRRQSRMGEDRDGVKEVILDADGYLL